MKQFSTGSVLVAVAARVYGKDPCWIRAGIVSGWLPIGTATRNGKRVTSVEEIDSRRGRINYYISPYSLYKETGYIAVRRSFMSCIDGSFIFWTRNVAKNTLLLIGGDLI